MPKELKTIYISESYEGYECHVANVCTHPECDWDVNPGNIDIEALKNHARATGHEAKTIIYIRKEDT